MHSFPAAAAPSTGDSAPYLELVEVPAGTLIGFKALPCPDLGSALNAGPSNPTDWSAIYPQFSFVKAMAYLPNQWERGHAQACIVALTAAAPLRMLVLTDLAFADGATSAAAKAVRIREAYAAAYSDGAAAQQVHGGASGASSSCLPQQLPEGPLMTALGAAGLCICAPDADGPELIIPHSLFTSARLHSEVVCAFEQSATRPLTVGRVLGVDLACTPTEERRMLGDVVALGRVLAERVNPIQCTELLRLIGAVHGEGLPA